MKKYDVIIIGASFSGLTLAHYLPKNLNILIVDKKRSLDAGVESTGLITAATRELLADFLPVDDFIPNNITHIGVISPDYDESFFSKTVKPWIYSTDTPKLLEYMALTVPENVEIITKAEFKTYKKVHESLVEVDIKIGGKIRTYETTYLIGADGASSRVAKQSSVLSKNKDFLIGFEKVFYGDIYLGPKPESTVYHFWFGEFSLGYGGWLSPTIIDGKKAFRVGLAKLEKDAADLHKLNDFIKILHHKNIISFSEQDPQSLFTFSSDIAIGGVRRKIVDDTIILIGEAAGFCGAFAADGIKGAVVSGKVIAQLITEHKNGNKSAFKKYKKEVNRYQKLITYYHKQVLYRKIWNIMRKNRTFMCMYEIIKSEKEDFLEQFCDSKDKDKSLIFVILKVKNIPKLIKYSYYLVHDLFIFKRNS